VKEPHSGCSEALHKGHNGVVNSACTAVEILLRKNHGKKLKEINFID